MRVLLAVFVVCACSSERRSPAPARAPLAQDAASDASTRSDAAIDARSDAAVAATLDDALDELHARGAGAAADVIAARVAQRSAKMRLEPEDAHRAALALVAVLDREPVRVLIGIMPRSTVELARAAAERGLPLAELEAIAAYLARVVATLAPGRLHVFDENHSHVTGRDWHEIDYTGEGMTWQSQRAYWSPRGVASFKRATDIHAYFVGAERLPHWRRVYRPRGKMTDVAAPE